MNCKIYKNSCCIDKYQTEESFNKCLCGDCLIHVAVEHDKLLEEKERYNRNILKYIKKEDVNHIKNEGDILACKYYHSFAYPNGIEAIGDCDSKKIDGKNWDIFHIHYETKDAYYGIPILGMGLIDCMILKTDTRPFLEDEFNYTVGMYGSHTGKFINKYNIQIEPIINKF